MVAENTDRLVRLKTMKKHRVASGDHDIRGWDVVTSDHKRVGSVDDLVFDTESMRTRYVVIRVDRKILDTKSDSHMLLPIAGASLDPNDKRVYLEEIDSERLLAVPPYDNRRITRDYERLIRDMFRWNDGGARRAGTGDFYDHPAYSEGRMYRRRHTDTVDAMGAQTATETQPVDADVDQDVRRERLQQAERLRAEPSATDTTRRENR